MLSPPLESSAWAARVHGWHFDLASVPTTVTLAEALAERARQPGIAVSAAARQGVAEAVRRVGAVGREAHRKHPERVGTLWSRPEGWPEP